MHYSICMVGSDPDPINSGTMASWFSYYKWNPGGDDEEVFFPIPEDILPAIQAGDTVWFVMDGKVIGKASLVRVEADEINDRVELWYNCKDCVAMRTECSLSAPAAYAPMQEQDVEALEELLLETGDTDAI